MVLLSEHPKSISKRSDIILFESAYDPGNVK